METEKSPRMVLIWAHHLGKQVLPEYADKFSRHDFTLPQLFACLVLREHQKKSYRGVEALLRCSPQWLADIGMTKAPDHNTLCRAFGIVARLGKLNSMLDLQVKLARRCGLIQGLAKPAALDSSLFESRHVSRHFEKRCRETAGRDKRKKGSKHAEIQGNRKRSQTIKKLPKLSLAVSSLSHLILAARPSTGGGPDYAHFKPLLTDTRRRAAVTKVVADAGFDSEPNHQFARKELGVQSIMPAGTGRPGKHKKLPAGRWRRRMRRLLGTKRGRKRSGYTQRWQVETVNSMIKRNLGSALRARTARRRSMELMLRCVTHNLMIFRCAREGRDRAVAFKFFFGEGGCVRDWLFVAKKQRIKEAKGG
jgi:hypothetical protein